jgi:hypothetical protein
MNLPEEFERKVERITETGCWVWMGRVTQSKRGAPPYAVFRKNGKDIRIHRMLAKVSGDLFACHPCGVSVCINPAHIYAGSAADNNRDTREMGRARGGNPNGRPPVGEHHWNAKLTRALAEQIRLAEGSLREIASRFGVTKCTVHKIKHRKIWK